LNFHAWSLSPGRHPRGIVIAEMQSLPRQS
jgi:hypothetical protein